MENYRNLQDFLDKHRYDKSKHSLITHTRIPDTDNGIFGLSLSIPDEDLPTFYKLYYDEVVTKNKFDYLTEKQNKNGLLYVDLDFKYAELGRHHTEETVQEILGIYHNILVEVFQFDENDKFNVYVLERDAPYTNKEGKHKDGIHIVFQINCPRNINRLIRKKAIERIDFTSLPLTNSIEDVFDDGIAQGVVNLQLALSKKPNCEPYKLTYAQKWYNYDSQGFSIDNIQIDSMGQDILENISARGNPHLCDVFAHSKAIDEAKEFDPKPKNTVVSSVNISATKDTDKFFEYAKLIPDSFYETYYNGVQPDWLQLFWISRTMGVPTADFDKFCENKPKYDKDKNEAFYEKESNKLQVGFTRLKEIVMKYNPEKCVELNNKYREKPKQPMLDILCAGERDIALAIKPILKDVLVYSCKQWWLFDYNTKLWRVSSKPDSRIIGTVHIQIDLERQSILEKMNAILGSSDAENKLREDFNQQLEDLGKHRKQVAGGNVSSTIKKYLEDELLDNLFIEKLDNYTGFIAFQNGKFDLKQGKFVGEFQKDDFVTHTIPFDYTESTESDREEVRRIFKKICNWNESHLNYYLSRLGYAMTGEAEQLTEMYYLLGQKACNGKSVIFDALTKIIPNYVKKVDSELFESNYKDRHKTIAELRGKRIIFANELSTRKQDAEFIKAVADGTSIPYKVMYGTTAIMNILFKLFVISNHSITINMDAGVARRFKLFQLDSDFVDGVEDDYERCIFKKDTELISKLTGIYKDALLDVIFEYSKKWYDNKFIDCPYPDDWKDESNEVVQQSDRYNEWFHSCFEIGADYEIPTYKIQECSTSLGKKLDAKEIKDILKRLRISFEYDSQAPCGVRGKRGMWRGFREIPEETIPEATAVFK